MTNEQVRQAILHVLSEWNTSPRAINEGECLEFATEVYNYLLEQEPLICVEQKRTGDDDVLGRDLDDQYDIEPFHVWVYYEGKHYDCETPDGVAKWNYLPFFVRCGF